MHALKQFVVMIWTLSAVFSVCAQDNSPKYSNEFLTLGVGARYIGMGGAGVSIANDVTAGYWNPAGLLNSDSRHQLMLMHASYFAGIANYDFAGFTTSIDTDQRLSFNVIRFAVDDIPDTRFLFDSNGALNYDRIRFFTAADYAFLTSYAQKLDWFSGLDVGGTVKIIHRRVGNFSRAWGFGLDFGAQKSIGNWNLGISWRDAVGTFNAWNHNENELRDVFNQTGNDIPIQTLEVTLPRVIIGASYLANIKEYLSILATFETHMTLDGKRNTVLAGDVLSVDPLLGLEIGYKNVAFLRFGAGQIQKVTELSGREDWKFQPNGGVGIKIRELSIDYALTDLGDNAQGLYSHIFSIMVDFNAK
jgi:hypothetical protein